MNKNVKDALSIGGAFLACTGMFTMAMIGHTEVMVKSPDFNPYTITYTLIAIFALFAGCILALIGHFSKD